MDRDKGNPDREDRVQMAVHFLQGIVRFLYDRATVFVEICITFLRMLMAV